MLTILSICSSLVIFQQNEKTSPLGLVSGCDPDRIQTCDFQNRNLTFYSAELRGQYLWLLNSFLQLIVVHNRNLTLPAWLHSAGRYSAELRGQCGAKVAKKTKPAIESLKWASQTGGSTFGLIILCYECTPLLFQTYCLCLVYCKYALYVFLPFVG